MVATVAQSALSRSASAATASTSGRPWSSVRPAAPGVQQLRAASSQRRQPASGGGAACARRMSGVVQAVAAPEVATNGAPGECERQQQPQSSGHTHACLPSRPCHRRCRVPSPHALPRRAAVRAPTPPGPRLPPSLPRRALRRPAAGRVATVKRVTKETNVSVTINLDGTGQCHSKSGVRGG